MAGDHETLAADYGSCAGRSELRLSSERPGAGETELLIKNVVSERRVMVSRRVRAVVTVVILTVINLLNYTDRFIIAGQSTARHILILLFFLKFFLCIFFILYCCVFVFVLPSGIINND